MTEIRTGPARHDRARNGTEERDEGLFQIGLEGDAAGPFPSRTFAAVAVQTRQEQNALPAT
jgi:hypothetical protein